MNLPRLTPTQEYDIISAIIDAVGRNIVLTYVSARGPCSVCNNNDPFCATCLGNQTVDTVSTKTVKANIRWKSSDRKVYRANGQEVEGDCTAHFMPDSVEDFDDLDELLKKIISVTVDGRILALRRWYFKGSPVNRVYLVLVQDENVDGQRIG